MHSLDLIIGKVRERAEHEYGKYINEKLPILDSEISKGRHSRTKCMICSKTPEIEVLYAEGKAHAWFCKEHYKEWESKEAFKLDGKPVTNKKIVNTVREIDGEASGKWSEPIKEKNQLTSIEGHKPKYSETEEEEDKEVIKEVVDEQDGET